MYENNAPAQLVTPWGTILFNQDLGGGAMYWIDNTSGFDGIPIRAPMEDSPVSPGLLWHDFQKSGRRITIEGQILVSKGTAWNEVVERNVMGVNLEDALDSIAQELDVTGTYSWTMAGFGTKNLTVRNDIAINYTGKLVKSFVFGLVAADPFIF